MRKARCHEWIPALWRLTKLRRKENEQILQFESHLTYIDESQSYNWFMFSFILIMCRIQTDNVILSKWVLKASFMANEVYVHRWCVKRKNGDWCVQGGVGVWEAVFMKSSVTGSGFPCTFHVTQGSRTSRFNWEKQGYQVQGKLQGAGLAGARCKAAQNLKRLFLWRRNASQIAQLHWVI